MHYQRQERIEELLTTLVSKKEGGLKDLTIHKFRSVIQFLRRRDARFKERLEEIERMRMARVFREGFQKWRAITERFLVGLAKWSRVVVGISQGAMSKVVRVWLARVEAEKVAEQQTLQAAEEIKLRKEKLEEVKKRKLQGLGLVVKKLLFQRAGLVFGAIKISCCL